MTKRPTDTKSMKTELQNYFNELSKDKTIDTKLEKKPSEFSFTSNNSSLQYQSL